MKRLMLLTLSCFICSIGLNWIALPNGFVVTGMTGLALTLSKFTGLHYALLSYVIVAIVLIITRMLMGKKEVANILFLSLLYPAVLWVTNHFQVSIIFKEKLIAVALFGLLFGTGTGIAYKLGYSYGGTDTIGKLLKHTVFKTVQLKIILMILDGLILLIMLTAFDLDTIAYGVVGQFIYVNSMNYVIFNAGPKLYEVQIIINGTNDIENFVIHEIKKSVTIHNVKGGYTKETKSQIDCVCTSKEYVRLREYIKKSDTECFIKVIPLTHVFGQDKDFMKIQQEIIE